MYRLIKNIRRAVRNLFNTKFECGFSVVELAALSVIAGVISAPAAKQYIQHLQEAKLKKTVIHITNTDDALLEFFVINGRYPCPADPTLGPGDARYGHEQCRPDPAADPCPSGLFCVGGRDANGDGNPDAVMIGAVPFATILDYDDDVNINGITGIDFGEETFSPKRFRAVYTIDGYSTKLGYAVSELMTDNPSYSVRTPAPASLGAIAVVDEFGLPLVDEENFDPENPDAFINDPEGSIQFTVFSYGQNREGGYTKDGDELDGCVVNAFDLDGNPTEAEPEPGPFATGGLRPDLENCDNNDAIFVSGLISLGDNNQYFDDVLKFTRSDPNVLWRRATTNPNFAYNANFGNVGIGENNPDSAIKLDVDGDISATGIHAGAFCDSTGNNCMNPQAIGGELEDMKCPPQEVVTAIAENKVICVPLNMVAPVSVECGPEEYVNGVSNFGTLRCIPLP